MVSCGNGIAAIVSALRYWLAVPLHGRLLSISHSEFITNIVSRQPGWMDR